MNQSLHTFESFDRRPQTSIFGRSALLGTTMVPTRLVGKTICFDVKRNRVPFYCTPLKFHMDTLEAVELKRVTFLETTH